MEKDDLTELLEMFGRLGLNEKRNELSSLVETIDGMVVNLLALESFSYGKKVKNYDSVNDKNMTEDEMMKFLYEDLWNLKTKLLLFMSFYVDKK